MYDNVIGIAFLGFNGLDFNFSSIFKSFPLIDPKQLGLYFVFSEFSFYLNGEKVEINSLCDENEEVKRANEGIFTAAFFLTINFEFKSPDSSFNKWCPMVFKRAELLSFSTTGKPLRFNKESVAQTNIDIQSLELDNLVVEYLNDEILNPQIYSKVKSMYLRGTVKKIQIDVFKELTDVNYIALEFYNFKGFIYGNRIEWMNNINYYSTPADSSLLEIKCDQKCLETLRSSMVSVQINSIFLGQLSLPSSILSKCSALFISGHRFLYFFKLSAQQVSTDNDRL
jgi:hypothetical protein